MGVKLMKNFDIRTSPVHRRILAPLAHFSFHWFRDYLYIPLGGNRVSKPRWHSICSLLFWSAACGMAPTGRISSGRLAWVLFVLSELTEPLWQRLSALTRLDKLPRLKLLLPC